MSDKTHIADPRIAARRARISWCWTTSAEHSVGYMSQYGAAMKPRSYGLLLAALLILISACSGSDDTGSNGEDSRELGSIVISPDWVPDGLNLRFGCIREAEERAGVTVLGYRGDGRYKSEIDPICVETAFLRIFAFDFDAGVEFDDPSFSIDDVLDEAKPGSVAPTIVRGMDAQVFLVASGEEPTAWPAVVWTEGQRLYWLLGEGLDEAAVVLVANSLEAISLDRFRELVDNEQC